MPRRHEFLVNDLRAGRSRNGEAANRLEEDEREIDRLRAWIQLIAGEPDAEARRIHASMALEGMKAPQERDDAASR